MTNRVDSGGAEMCRIGETPAAGITVGELIKDLKQYPKSAQVGFATSCDSNLEILSLYKAEDGTVWFDLGER